MGNMLQLTFWTKRADKAAVLPTKQVARRPSRAPEIARFKPAQSALVSKQIETQTVDELVCHHPMKALLIGEHKRSSP